jgi:hypothetical protein
MNFTQIKLVVPLVLLAAAPQVRASCGSMACEVNPAWDIDSLTHDHGLRLDVRYTYAKADTLRAGSDKITAAEPSGSGEEIENKYTRNQSLAAELDYAVNRAWSVAVLLPLTSREHAHTLDVTPPEVEQAGYRRLGDMRVSGRYRFMAADHQSGGGVRFGLKLPTGDSHRQMAPGEPMEASLQPGTGSTDLLLGGYLHWSMPDSVWGGFAQIQGQTSIAHRSGYEPGTGLSLDLGAYYPFNESVTGLLQLNYLYRARDKGVLADADGHSGGHALYISPGLSLQVAGNMHVYGLIQIPVKQEVHGEQLTAPWTATLGLRVDL